MDRIIWIDNLKGLLLLFICLSHFGYLPNIISPLIAPTASYWVPIFFILSGYLYKEHRDFKEYSKRKFSTLFLPYFIFSFIFLIFDLNLYVDTNYLPKNLYRICIEGIGCFKASPLWFVWVLYGCSILSYAFIENIKNITFRISAVFLLSLIPLYLSYINANPIFQLDIILSATIFFVSGYLSKYLINKLVHFKIYYLFILICLTIGVIGLLLKLGDFHFNQINLYPLFYICPLCFTIGISFLLNKINRINLFTWFARNGITILASHCYFVILYDYIIKKIPLDINSNINFILKIIFVFSILYFVWIPIINKYFYWAIGKNKK